MAKNPDRPVIRLPFYARASLILVGLFVLLTMLALAQKIIVPLLFAIVFSILLSTIVDFLELKKVDRIISIWITLMASMVIVVLIGFWILSMFNTFIDQLPELNEKFDVLQDSFAKWLSESFGVKASKTNEWMDGVRTDLTTMSAERFGSTITTLGNALVIMILIPVYIFLIL